MTTVRVNGIFDLEDPPAGAVDWFREVVDHITYPMWRVLPYVRADPDEIVRVVWTNDSMGGIYGRWYGFGTLQFNLQKWIWDDKSLTGPMSFTAAHEIGHMIDTAVLVRYGHRPPILDAMHVDTWGTDPCVPGGDPTSWHLSSGEPWGNRHTEAFADMFVAAFAPVIWNNRTRRTWHWNNDLDHVRQILMEATVSVPFTDIEGESAEVKEAIEWAYATGIMGGTSATTFDPGGQVTRRQNVVMLKRLYTFDKGEGGT